MAFVVENNISMPVKIGSEKANQVHHAIKTTYARMPRQETKIDMGFSITLGAANWEFLAGYLVNFGTLISLQTPNQVEKTLQTNGAGRAVLHLLQNPPFLAIACLLFVSGIAALMWLVHFPKLKGNYSWLINTVFVPLYLHAAAELLTTVINVCTSQGGDWSVMAIITTVVTGGTLLICSALLALYMQMASINGN
ncbi:unnamed protein product [Penicillium nalgiovense]|uniref:Uncharacterized protein n=1 Tax=Penicillium nalgiovense TaxID=60175 RepID=A0A9W4MT54_PENNA|nr:unnamed protein product [Penicillium nalgiovense]CAG8033352.1 unnamed protein product [Penicillium nalgiovense]CAG8039077.1 unnamed protein product [Penicillium nalgiovense]CAG8039581.1 unnamed protein product [Penicillium nalgiovense]CAG8057900.1 unnamed protein product [Penicillium nalgiovense]